jgi:hypothetical protein
MVSVDHGLPFLGNKIIGMLSQRVTEVGDVTVLPRAMELMLSVKKLEPKVGREWPVETVQAQRAKGAIWIPCSPAGLAV